MGKFFRRNFYTQEGRDIKARQYRDGRRFGIYNNRVLMGIELSYTPEPDFDFDSERMKYYKGMQTLADSGRLGACSDDPPSPFTSRRNQQSVDDDIALEVGGAVEEDVAAACAVPQEEQAAEAQEVDPETPSSSERPTPKSPRRGRRAATRKPKLQLSFGFE
jgi:hypothetical protein